MHDSVSINQINFDFAIDRNNVNHGRSDKYRLCFNIENMLTADNAKLKASLDSNTMALAVTMIWCDLINSCNVILVHQNNFFQLMKYIKGELANIPSSFKMMNVMREICQRQFYRKWSQIIIFWRFLNDNEMKNSESNPDAQLFPLSSNLHRVNLEYNFQTH